MCSIGWRPQTFWQEHGGTLAALALVLVGSIAVAGLHGIEKNLRPTAKPITGTNVGAENIPRAAFTRRDGTAQRLRPDGLGRPGPH